MRDYTFFVYILASRSRVLYTGVTNSVQRRTLEHRDSSSHGFTQRYRVWRLVHYEKFQYVRSAIAREKQIKSWSRWRKVALIEETNATWEDLSLLFGAPAKLGTREARHFGDAVKQQIPTAQKPRLGMTAGKGEAKERAFSATRSKKQIPTSD